MGSVDADDLLRRGREALAAADWEEARSCFEGACARGETPEALAGLSEVAHFEGEYERAIELKERAFAAYRRSGKRVEAADLARWLAFLHVSCHGNFSVEFEALALLGETHVASGRANEGMRLLDQAMVAVAAGR